MNIFSWKSVFLIIIVLICTWLCLAFAVYKGFFTTITTGKLQLTPDNHYLRTNNGFVFDTGAMCSVIVGEEAVPSIFMSPAIISDSGGGFQFMAFHLFPKLNLDGKIEIRYLGGVCRQNNYDDLLKVNSIKVIIGMNVLKKANWLFSMRDNTATILPLDSVVDIPHYASCMSFDSEHYPMTNLKTGIGDINMLIDTGLDIDMVLTEEYLVDVLKMKDYQQTVVSNEYLFGKEQQKQFTIAKMKINNQVLKDVIIRKANINMLGLGYLRRFNNVFWNNKDKKIYLWN